MSSRKLFDSLRQRTLCDGRGLKLRQSFRKCYGVRKAGEWTINPQFQSDEEIEVFVYNVTCDETGALPCRQCGIPVCEECRYYPRAEPARSYANRRPHVSGSRELYNIMALCVTCDAATERDVQGKFLSEVCDCDCYTRWVCSRCAESERTFVSDYFRASTKMEWDWEEEEDEENHDDIEDVFSPSKYHIDHAFYRAFWCLCGATVHQDTRFRCTWCKRRHLPEDEWEQEYEIGRRLPFFDDNPNYPRWTHTGDRHYPKPYPRLGYARPGDNTVT